ncbi:UNVERIFIED_CONTAM: Copia protein [Sesamum indicum]
MEDSKTQQIIDMLKLQSAENSTLGLVSAPLDGTNYLSWARSMIFALGARQKVGFIDGTCPKPTQDKTEIEQWQKIDCMVITWILNSISKNIVQAFLYTTSARDLWLELESRFGESNGPLLYQIQREIGSITQNNNSVAVYFTNLKRLWDELAALDPLPPCSCGAGKKLVEKMTSTQLIQFLVGLSDAYDHVRNQILLMDPLPSIGKAYSMIARVEKQRQLNSGIHGFDREEIMTVQTQDSRRQGFMKRKSLADKKQMYCDYCKKSGHIKDNCFELKGFPDWYKDLVEQRKRNGKQIVNRALTTQGVKGERGSHTILDENAISEIIRKELKKALQSQELNQDLSNLADYEDFAGNTLSLNNSNVIHNCSWIIDSGASTHMCMNRNLFKSLQPLKNKSFIKLPDGSSCEVEHAGNIDISQHIMLKDVLYVPSFNYNLLSVSKLCASGFLSAAFFKEQCLVQDLVTRKVIAVGRQRGKLYLLDHKTEEKTEHIGILETYPIPQSEKQVEKQVVDDGNLWHNRLGHAGQDVMLHLPCCKRNVQCIKNCQTCPLAKQHRLPFHLSETQSQKIFDLIHVDVWGPYRQYSINNCSYMLTIVDDYSRAV